MFIRLSKAAIKTDGIVLSDLPYDLPLNHSLRLCNSVLISSCSAKTSVRPFFCFSGWVSYGYSQEGDISAVPESIPTAQVHTSQQ